MAKMTAIFEFRDRISRKLIKPLQGMRRITEATEKTNRIVKKLNNTHVAPKITVNDRASRQITETSRKLSDLDNNTANPTVKINDKASSVIEDINGRLDRMKAVTIGLAGAAGISAGGLMFAGQNAFEMDSRAAALTGMNQNFITSATQDIYYGQKAGLSRANVVSSISNIGQQTDLTGSDLTGGAALVSKLNSLNPNADDREITRAFTAFYNAQGTSFERVGDSLAYVMKNGGDQYEDLFDTFNEYASTYAKLQISPEQLASALVAGQNAGAHNYDVLGDSIREFGIETMTNMEDNAINAFRDIFGENKTREMFKSLNDGSLSGGQMIAEFANRLSEIDSAALREELAKAVFLTKYEDIGKPILRMAESLSKAANTTGELNRQFDTMRASPITPINDTLRNMQLLLEDTGRNILTGVGPAFDKLNKWMISTEGQAAIANFSESVKDLAVAFGQHLAEGVQWTIENWDTLLPILKTAAVIFGLLFSVVKIAKFVKFVGSAFAELKGFGKGIAWLFRGQKGSGGGVIGFIQKIIKIPWITKIGQFVDAGWKFFTMISGFLIKGLSWLGRAFVTLLKFIRPVLPWIVRLIGVGVRFIPVIGWIITAVTAVYWAFKNWDKILSFLKPIFDWFKEDLSRLGLLLGPLSQLVFGVYQAWKDWDGIKAFLEPFFNWFDERIVALKGWIDGLTDKFSKLMEYASQLGSISGKLFTGDIKIGLPKALGGDGLVQLNGVDGSHARGISNIPFNGYRAELHKGETVLPRTEAELIRSMATNSRQDARGSGDIYLEFTGDNHYASDMDAKKIANIAIQALRSELSDVLTVGAKGVYSA
ncbi:MAG: phage tail tape measure protein [Candidatus Pristimantibacillus sp.]